MRNGKIKIKTLAVLTILGVFIIAFVRQELTMKRLNKNIATKNEELQQLQDENVKLQDEVERVNSDSYIERLARERLGMIRSGEKVIISSSESN
ncbi:MAG: septum formation initiator family protein [Clostridium perfringens]|nr:septum formation initiator family protein [Clostridium perfringens]